MISSIFLHDFSKAGPRKPIGEGRGWHFVGAAYLRSVFFLNLKPVEWDLITKEFEGTGEGGAVVSAVYEELDKASETSGIRHSEKIRRAIKERDSSAFFADSTIALSQLVRYYLVSAAKSLGSPSTAKNHVDTARALFQTFGRYYIRQTDMESYRLLEHAWNEIDLRAEEAGAGTSFGNRTSARKKYLKARDEIEIYLTRNYETEALRYRAHLVPLPETAFNSREKSELEPVLPPGSNIQDQEPLPRQVLNYETLGFDQSDLFLSTYGDMVFDSPEIFGSPAESLGISCSTCHNRSDVNRDFFIPGLSHQAGAVDVDSHFFNPGFNDMRRDSIDIPSLRGIRFTAPYGRDGRFMSLRDFVRNVIVNEFAGEEPTDLVLDSLVSYLLEFDWLPSPYLNVDGTLNDKATAAAERGEILFRKRFTGMDNMSCAECHVHDSDFLDGKRHDIGTGRPDGPFAREAFFDTEELILLDTPTLYNIQYTAPYMHDGSLSTLPEVVEWFDSRFDLGLNREEKMGLVSYLEAVGSGLDPYETFNEENTLFRLKWKELKTFLNLLDTLLADEDAFHAGLLIDTVTRAMKENVSLLKDTHRASLVAELTEKLVEIKESLHKEEWKKGSELWAEYLLLEGRIGPLLK
jgi:cytochrome c peroxidase